TLEFVVSSGCETVPVGGMTHWWSFNNHAKDMLGTADGAWWGKESYQDGYVQNSYNAQDDFSIIEIADDGTIDLITQSEENTWSLDFWVQQSSSGKLLEWNDGDTRNHITFSYNNLEFMIETVAADVVSSTSARVSYSSANTDWNHITYTYDGEYLSAYINSIKQFTTEYTLHSEGFSGDLFIGGSPTDLNASGFVGAIDELTTYNKALSQREILTIFQSGVEGKSLPTGNAAPYVSAGHDKSVDEINKNVQLQGYATDDGNSLSYQWSLLSGPGIVSFEDPSSLASLVSADQEGVYLLQLKVSDGQFCSIDTIELHVAIECGMPALSGTTHWWSFNGHARDLIGGVDGYWYGTESYQDGLVGTSFDAQGSSNVIEIENIDNGLNLITDSEDGSWTIETWVKYESGSGDLIQWNNNGEVNNQLQFQSTRLFFYHDYNDISRTYLWTNFDFRDFEWHHLSYTYDGTFLSCYIDGVYINGVTRTLDATGFEGNLYLGGLPAINNSLKGALDELTFYDRALNLGEIQAIYQAGECGKDLPNGNTPPSVDAGRDQSTGAINTAVALQGYASDDIGITATSWTKLSGPGALTFSDSSSLSTSVSADVAGLYVLEVEVSDGQYTATDSIEFHVASDCSVPLLNGVTHWWSLNGHTRDLLGGADGYWYGTESYQEGLVGTSFNAQATRDVIEIENIDNDLNLITDSSDGTWTMETWVKYESGSGDLIQWNNNGEVNNQL
ncbi:LamG domain-containing protein, partial [Akkermansiaceae bacterium]|nr:LamG domain-containing protein [Akkermansiaceae bacterium]